MPYAMEVEARPFSTRGKILLALNLLLLIAIVLIAVRYYFALPDRVPVHYDVSGKPTSYGDKVLLVYAALAFMIAPTVIVTFAAFRFKLINRYPYLINLPAFMMQLKELPREQRGSMVNMVFEAMLAVGVVVSLEMVLIEYIMFKSAINPVASQLMVYIIPLSTLMTVGVIGVVIFMYKKINDRLKLEIERHRMLQGSLKEDHDR